MFISKNKITFVLFFFCYFFVGVLSAEKIVAITTNVDGTVKVKSPPKRKYKTPMTIGYPIRNDDWVQTGHESWTAVVFVDDNSQLKIIANTEVQIKTIENQTGSLAKRISMELGKIKATVTKSGEQDFVISTPTSIASVKGTEFWVQSNREGDVFVILSGEVEIKNQISGRTQRVNINETCYSNKDGTTRVDITQPEMIPNDPEETGDTGNNKLIIPLKDELGRKKDIIIEYK